MNEKGIKIGGLAALGDWYKEHAAEPAVIDKRKLTFTEKLELSASEGVAFLDKHNARVMPVGEYDKYITVRDTWVFIRGWMTSEEENPDKKLRRKFHSRLKASNVDIRFLINALSLRSRLLLLDPLTEQVFRYFRHGRNRKHFLATADAFRMTLQILYLVKNGYIQPRAAIDPSFLEESYRRVTDPALAGISDVFTVREKSLLTLDSIKSNIDDSFQILPELVTDRWVVLDRPTYHDDGFFHYLTLPSWMFGMEFDSENKVQWSGYIGHRIDQWAYYNRTFEPEEKNAH